QVHYGVDMPTTEGLKIPQMFNAAIEGKLKALWVLGEDIAQTDPNQQHVLKALDNLDFLVVQEIFMSETAKLADVVLPGSSFLEKSGTFTNGERRIQAVNAAVKPLQGCKTDGQILADVIERMTGKIQSAEPEELLKEISQIVPFFAGVKWNELGEQGKQWPVLNDGLGTDILHITEFKRGKGKFHFYPWEESQEMLSNADAFPFILTTSRVLEHYNAATMTRRTGNKELVDKDILLINPKDARRKNISTDDKVTLKSERGEIEMVAELSKKVKPGILFTTFHFPELMVNRLTGDVCDTETMCPEYKVVAVDVELAV
ncbi:MAG: molybdopterin-dependent oxidoreductase, partial [Kangiellaceae bacterium]|nr:molybdopterin-dependent oxidoreductase [Kangiellaceae bacterium]